MVDTEIHIWIIAITFTTEGQMAPQHTPPARSYRATYHPKDQNGYPVVSESGVLPSIRLKAPNAEAAALLAGATTGSVIAGVERLDDEAELEFAQ